MPYSDALCTVTPIMRFWYNQLLLFYQSEPEDSQHLSLVLASLANINVHRGYVSMSANENENTGF